MGKFGTFAPATAPQPNPSLMMSMLNNGQPNSFPSSASSAFSELFKPLLANNHSNGDAAVVQQQQQQLLATQLMAQMFAASLQQTQMQDPGTMMAQMAAQMAAAVSATGSLSSFMDMFGAAQCTAPKSEPTPVHHETRDESNPSPNFLNNLMRASAPPNGAEADEGPRAKRSRADSTPAAQRPQRPWINGVGNGENRTSREGSVADSCTPSAITNSSASGLDLASVLQALASGHSVPTSGSFGFSPPPDPGLLMAAAMAGQIAPQPPQPPPATANSNAPSPSPQKRARTRIADEQVKILRQYFDINNSPSEDQIKEMAQKAQLPEKVIKHWFRNTLFKERQRDKDSPYNFAIPPQMGIDLATYHRTGEARIIPVGSGGGGVKEEIVQDQQESGERSGEIEKDEEKKEEEEKQREHNNRTPEETEEKQTDEREEEEEAEDPNPPESKDDFLAAIGKQQANALPPVSFPFFGSGAGANPAESFASMFSALPFQSLAHLAANATNGPPAALNPFNPFGLSTHPLLPNQPLPSTVSSASASVPCSSTVSSGVGLASATMSGSSGSGGGSGRRANRTRFTDFQLRTLQQFFDKQAYPKDDDLEMLSKKMGLSPRVIVVWFQNARQKARKVFEQQPQLLAQAHQQHLAATATATSSSSAEGNDTSGSIRPNFQCARCQQVFGRYLEMIQHQQRVCFAAERTATDSNGWLEQQENNPGGGGERGSRRGSETSATMLEQSTQELLRALVAQQQNNASMAMTEQEQSQQVKSEPGPSSATSHKRCPHCGHPFHCRDSLLDHLAQRHPEHPMPDVDALPEVSSSTEPLDLSISTASSQNNNVDQKEEWLGRSCVASLSPAAFSLSEEGTNDPSGDGAPHSQACSPFAPVSGALLPLFQPLAQRPQNQLSPGGTQTSGGGSSKRFRTHLTPMQVFIMKSLFNDYKTPSMQECDLLGQRIGLHKRVVQVWFQNARAKERKCTGGGGGSAGSGAESSDDSAAIPHCGPPNAQQCRLCDDVEFGARLSMQEHIFSVQHIARVRERGSQMRGVGGNAGGEEPAEKRGKRDSVGEADTDADGQTATDPATDLAAMAQQFPYGLMYAAAASGIPTGALPPLLYDPSLFGTPVPALKIPKGVMQQILADMARRREHTRFTQDGLELADLAEKVNAEEFRNADTVDLEVGWGCPQCGNVFQQPEQLQNHQKLICSGGADGGTYSGGVFRLIQTHYRCTQCADRFGTQDEFLAHCQTDGHKFKQDPENNINNHTV